MTFEDRWRYWVQPDDGRKPVAKHERADAWNLALYYQRCGLNVTVTRAGAVVWTFSADQPARDSRPHLQAAPETRATNRSQRRPRARRRRGRGPKT